MSETVYGQLRAYTLRNRHSILLGALVAAFLLRPMVGQSGLGSTVFSFVVLLVLLAALAAVQVDDLVGDQRVLLGRRRRHVRIAWVLGVLALGERLWVFLAPSGHHILAGVVVWLVFFLFTTWSQLRSLLRHREITRETISMAVSIYLLIGLTWALLYMVMWEFDPNAFGLGGASPSVSAIGDEADLEVLTILVYFSLTVLSTVGFGDITPLSMQARFAAVAEGLTGQLYLAILVARLIAMQMSRSQGKSS